MDAIAPGRVLNGKWTLGSLLGKGGSGMVYEAFHRNGIRAAVPSGQSGALERAMLERPPPIRSVRSSVPEVVARVVDRGLSHHREDRYPSARAMKTALDAARSGLGGTRIMAAPPLPGASSGWTELDVPRASATILARVFARRGSTSHVDLPLDGRRWKHVAIGAAIAGALVVATLGALSFGDSEAASNALGERPRTGEAVTLITSASIPEPQRIPAPPAEARVELSPPSPPDPSIIAAPVPKAAPTPLEGTSITVPLITARTPKAIAATSSKPSTPTAPRPTASSARGPQPSAAASRMRDPLEIRH